MFGNREHAVRYVAREALGSCPTMSGGFAAASLAKRTCSFWTSGCTNYRCFLCCSASGLLAGTRPKSQTVQQFPFGLVILAPGQQRLTVFRVPVLWQVPPMVVGAALFLMVA